ncbi:hypothetical protein LCGC14_1790090 [marine sediment metagenome]|uniref:Uncharacterized protein n=1 Tax=marine sediment metagenome TaxID=412755 RepID=A0A0F9JSE6_9ZZZZ
MNFFRPFKESNEEYLLSDKTFSNRGWVDFITSKGFDFVNYWEPEEYLFVKIGDPNERTLKVFPYRNTAT